MAKAAKRAGNETSEGKIKVVADGSAVYIAVVGCETDFVARNDTFDEMLNRFIELRKAAGTDAEAIEKAESLKTTEYTLKVGENMKIVTLTKIEGPVIGTYVHFNSKSAAVVVARAGTDAEKLSKVAMHVVASQPQVVRPEDISAEFVEKEREISLAQMKDDPKNAGKPAEILSKIIEGKMAKLKEENALETQPFVMSPDQKVRDFIGTGNVISFCRFSI